MKKRERQGAILKLVRTDHISTQAQIVEALRDEGVTVVQTTVSRDVTELGLVKVRGSNGQLVYAPPGTTDPDRMEELDLALRRWALAIEASDNLVVITTPSGYADPLAQALDEAGHPMVLGTLAGENTVFVVTPEDVGGVELRDDLKYRLSTGDS